MPYWIVYKRGKYVTGTDEFGYPIHSKEEKDAWHFSDFNVAMSFFNLGYIIEKRYS